MLQDDAVAQGLQIDQVDLWEGKARTVQVARGSEGEQRQSTASLKQGQIGC